MTTPENRTPSVLGLIFGVILALLVVFALYGLSVEACRMIREAADKLQP